MHFEVSFTICCLLSVGSIHMPRLMRCCVCGCCSRTTVEQIEVLSYIGPAELDNCNTHQTCSYPLSPSSKSDGTARAVLPHTYSLSTPIAKKSQRCDKSIEISMFSSFGQNAFDQMCEAMPGFFTHASPESASTFTRNAKHNLNLSCSTMSTITINSSSTLQSWDTPQPRRSSTSMSFTFKMTKLLARDQRLNNTVSSCPLMTRQKL